MVLEVVRQSPRSVRAIQTANCIMPGAACCQAPDEEVLGVERHSEAHVIDDGRDNRRSEGSNRCAAKEFKSYGKRCVGGKLAVGRFCGAIIHE